MSWVDIRDAAKAFVDSMHYGRAGRTYLLGARNCSTWQLFALLERLTGVPKPRVSVPGWVALSGATALDWYNRRVRQAYDPSVDPVRAEMGCHFWNISCSAAEEDLNFAPRSPEQTIIDTVRYIREHESMAGKQSAKL